MMAPTSAIEVEALSRRYGKGDRSVLALDDVSFTVAVGEVVGLLGENGAGKTTLTKIISTSLAPSSGRVRVLGHDVVSQTRAARRVLAVVLGGDRGLYDRLTGRENLMFFAILNGASRHGLADRVAASLVEAGLDQAADRQVGTYSRGMRQRLHLAVGTINHPRVLLLDEPTVGLDPMEADRLRSRIEALRHQGVSILLTSHQLLDIEQLADRVILMHRGRITHAMSRQEFIGIADHVAVVVVQGRGQQPTEYLWIDSDVVAERIRTVADDTGRGWTLEVPVRAWNAGTIGWLGDLLARYDVIDVKVSSIRLDDVYRQLSPGDA